MAWPVYHRRPLHQLSSPDQLKHQWPRICNIKTSRNWLSEQHQWPKTLIITITRDWPVGASVALDPHYNNNRELASRSISCQDAQYNNKYKDVMWPRVCNTTLKMDWPVATSMAKNLQYNNIKELAKCATSMA
jgi:hypothetical protein